MSTCSNVMLRAACLCRASTLIGPLDSRQKRAGMTRVAKSAIYARVKYMPGGLINRNPLAAKRASPLPQLAQHARGNLADVLLIGR